MTDGDKRALASYLAALSTVRIGGYSRAEQFAYWVNLYNALTVKLILDHYPLASIRQIGASPVADVPLLGLLVRALATGPWGRRLVRVEGEALTLDDIEHRILRPIWRDPRIHYVISCAAVGCPELVAEAFTAANTEWLLEAAARAYVNHPRGARIEGGRLLVSSLYHWYGGDFGDGEAGLRVHLKRYAEPELAAAMADARGLGDGGYDWSLNDADKR